MKQIKKLIKKFDAFGVPFSFRYQDEGSYTSLLGGFFLIIFCIIVLIVGIYYFIPFYNRKNFSIIYYSMNIAKTGQIKLSESKTAFAVGLNCYDDEDGTKADDLLKLDVYYYTCIKTREGRIKSGGKLSTHNCNYADFYNSYNESFDLVNMGNYQCLDKTDDIIEGIYTDEKFAYYELAISSKNDSVEHFNKIDRYLSRNDCKLQLYYNDITIDFNDYKEPIKPYINTLFVQLNPTLNIKMNTYFMNQNFENDNYLIFIFEDEKSEKKTLFSRNEEYFLYRGLNRGETKSYDYMKYASIYIRADTKETVIKRKYQKLMEFYANISSILLGIFYILFIIFNFFNTFYVELSLSRKLFFFKNIEYNNFDHKKINKIINITEPLVNKNQFKTNILIESKQKNYYLGERKEKQMGRINNLENEEINIYNKKQNLHIKKKDNENLSSKRELKIIKYRRRKKNKDIIYGNSLTSSIIKKPRNELTKFSIENDSSNKLGMDNQESKSKIIKFSFDIFDIVASSFFCCCMTEKLKSKKNLKQKANILLYNNLDIFLFIKNMILIDIINQTLINGNKEAIIQLLSRHIISLEKEEKNINKNDKDFNEAFFDQLSYEIMEILKNPERIENEKKIITLSNNKLKELI